MRTLVIYDISDDRSRVKVSTILKEFGLRRVQYSGFIGETNPNDREVLERLLRRYLTSERDSIYIVPLCNRCFSLLRVMAKSKREKERLLGEDVVVL